MPTLGLDFQEILPSILESTEERIPNRFLRIQNAVDEARKIATKFDRAEEIALLAQAWSSPSGLIARFNLARHYHRIARYDDAIRIYLRLLSDGVILPKHRDHAGGNLDTPEVIYYNLACAFARKGDPELALECLRLLQGETAMRYLAYAETDSDFESLRKNPEFQELLEP